MPEDKARSHPAYVTLSMQSKGNWDHFQTTEARLKVVTGEMKHLRGLHERTTARFQNEQFQARQAHAQAVNTATAAAAAAASEKRALELQVARVTASHRACHQRFAELESLLKFTTGESERHKKEVSRLRGILSTREAERVEACSLAEAAAAKIQAYQHELDSLREIVAPRRSTLDVDLSAKLQEEQGKCREALVKASVAEQSVLHCRAELMAQRGGQQAMMEEIDTVTSTYEDVQCKNDELRQTIALKEETMARAKSGKVKSDQMVTLLRAQVAALRKQFALVPQLQEQGSVIRSAYELQMRKTAETMAKRDEEIHNLETASASQKATAQHAQLAAREATTRLKSSVEAVLRGREREAKVTTELATAQTSIQQLSDERDSLQRRLAKRQVGASGSGTGGNSGSSELEYYRKIVKCVRALFIHPCPTMLPVATLWDRCTLCRVNDKDAILSKCMHAFCRGCIDKRLSVRNRKCPACALQFDFQSVKDLFLTC